MTLIIVQTKVTSVIFYLEQINAASHILYVAFSLVNFFFFLLLILQQGQKKIIFTRQIQPCIFSVLLQGSVGSFAL